MTSTTKMPTWQQVQIFSDIKYESFEGIAKITINRPEVHNAFRAQTVQEMIEAFQHAILENSIGVIVLTGEGEKAFCSGGDQRTRGHTGYKDEHGQEHLNVLSLQKIIRSSTKPVIAMVSGYAIGGGHVLHVVCDLTIAADHSIFGQVGPRVGSFDGGFGAGHLAHLVGPKKAKEMWFLCKKYNAQEALSMGLVNKIVPQSQLENTTLEWCSEILKHSPLAIRCLKSAFNASHDGEAGIQELAGNATMLYYMTEEAQEGLSAFLEKRDPNFSSFRQ